MLRYELNISDGFQLVLFLVGPKSNEIVHVILIGISCIAS